MAEGEALREALLELSILREREAAALRESTALVEALATIAEADTPAAALEALFAIIARELGAAEVIALVCEEARCTVQAATSPGLAGRPFPGDPAHAGRPARIADAAALRWWDAVPEEIRAMGSALVQPIALAGAERATLLVLAPGRGRFSAGDQALLGRLAGVAAQVIANLALAERNALLAAAIDTTRDGVAVTDEAGNFLYMNRSHLEMFGFEREAEVTGRSWRMLYDEAEAGIVERIGLPELAATGTWRSEITGRRRDGGRVEQEVSLSRLPGIGIVCLSRDVAERHQNERERARLREQLHTAQRQEAVGQLAAEIAHDFNNLLSVVTGSCALAETVIGRDHAAAAHLQRALQAAGSASRLVTRLLDVKGRRTETVDLDARETVQEAADLLRAGVPSRIRVSASVPDAPVQLRADPTELMQVLLNLGINARDAMGSEAGELAIALTTETAAETARLAHGSLAAGRAYAVMEVRDTGTGLEPGAVDRIFRPYFTTKGEQGTGLGLAVVSGLTSNAGGAIAVRSEPGQGTRFRVYWPLAPEEAAAPPPAPDAATPDLSPAPDLSRATVLVCDDIAEVGETIAAALAGHGAEVAVCQNPEDALEAIADDPAAWTVLVTDHDMPGMTGAELARAVRAVAPGLPVLLIAGREEGRRHAGEADAFLAKPIDPDALPGAIAAAMAGRDARMRRAGVVA